MNEPASPLKWLDWSRKLSTNEILIFYGYAHVDETNDRERNIFMILDTICSKFSGIRNSSHTVVSELNHDQFV